MSVESINSATTAIAANESESELARQKLADDLDQFMLLLTTQLSNQDPLDPMDSAEFTSQLVEFASVEQQIQQNANLEALIRAQELSQLGSVAGYIGKTVEAQSDQLEVENGVAEFNYVLLDEAQSTQITILDEGGNTVFSQSGETDAGKHGVLWDGYDTNNLKVDDGTYQLIVVALNASDEPVDVQTTVVGNVDGASYVGDEPTLYMGNSEVALSQVISLRNAVGGNAETAKNDDINEEPTSN